MLPALGLVLVTAAIAPQQAPGVPLDSAWELSGDGSRIEQYQGRRAIRLRSGRAIRRDISFENGTIEFDLMVAPRRSFVSIHFRMAGDDDYEDMYFRPQSRPCPTRCSMSPSGTATATGSCTTVPAAPPCTRSLTRYGPTCA